MPTSGALEAWNLVERRSGADRRQSQVAARASMPAPPVAAIRWGALAVGFALGSSEIGDQDPGVLVGGVVLVAYTVLRTLRPLRVQDGTAGFLRVLFEVCLSVTVVVATGYWESPYVFSLITAIIVAGYERGFAFAIRISLASALAVAVPYVGWADGTTDSLRRSLQWTMVLLLVAMIAGYARRISTESARQHSLALDRLGRLAEANALLFSLHRLAQSLPASLDLDEVLDSTMTRLRDLIDFDAAVLLLLEETDSSWVPVRREGVRLSQSMSFTELPAPLRRAVESAAAVTDANLAASGARGLSGNAASGLYAALRARGGIVGLVALEHTQAHHFRVRDAEVLNGFVEPVALALDNARWFARLRTIGAEEERTRIARDLHDRIGQSLAYLAFELDRLVKAAERGDEVTGQLDTLRGDLRTVVREVRDTLYDLRTDVSEGQDVISTLSGFLDRVSERSSLHVTIRSEQTGRLPLPQEREIWRIAKEAVTNVEKHARASELSITWFCDGARATLVVSDNGVGFTKGTPTRLDSYGILGMRERAASIGARLELDSAPGAGTTVLVQLDPPQH